MNNLEKHSTKKWSEDILDGYKIFQPRHNKHLLNITKLLGEDMHIHMAQGLALFHMSALVNSLKFTLQYDSNGTVPLNVVVFLLSESGSGKTSSELKIRNAFKYGYDYLDLKIELKDEFIKTKHDLKDSDLPKLPYFNGIGTDAGFIKRINSFATKRIGVPALIIDEIVTNLNYKPDTLEMIKIISELFDSGEMTDKPLKDSANQADPIHGMGITTLLMGTDSGMFDNSQAVKLFEDEFAGKLSRRSIFVYPPRIKNNKKYSRDEHNEKVKTRNDNNPIHHKRIYEVIKKIIDFRKELLHDETLKQFGIQANFAEEELSKLELTLNGSARHIYDNYKEYCKKCGEDLPQSYIPTKAEDNARLEYENRHWKMLKIAGVFAVFRCSTNISREDLQEAITLVEEVSVYLKYFIEKTNTKIHEKVFKYIQDVGNLPSSHEMKIFGWIEDTREIPSIIASVQDMLIHGRIEFDDKEKVYAYKPKDNSMVKYSVVLATDQDLNTSDVVDRRVKQIASLDNDEFFEKAIKYYDLKKNADVQDIVTKINEEAKNKISNIKDNRSMSVSQKVFEYKEIDFKDFASVLNDNNSIVPFELKDGKRNKANCQNETDILIVDVDKSAITIHETHEALKHAQLNHILITTSDYQNLFKYRIILELKSQISVDDHEYKEILKAFQSKYSVEVDVLPKSQVILGYANSTVLQYFDGEKLDIEVLENSYKDYEREARVFKKRVQSVSNNNTHDRYKHWFSGKRDDNKKHRQAMNGLRLYAMEMGENKDTVLELIYDYQRMYKTDKDHLDKMLRLVLKDNNFNEEGENIYEQ